MHKNLSTCIVCSNPAKLQQYAVFRIECNDQQNIRNANKYKPNKQLIND